MKSVDLVLIDPPYDDLRNAVRDAVAAVNRDQEGHGEPIRCPDADVWELWQSFPHTPEGSREWRVRGQGWLHSVSASLVVVWWSDFLGRRHVRLVGACAHRGNELPLPIPSPQYPALACLYPATSLMVTQHRRLRLLALCDCGVWGRPEQLAWMGPCCGPCFDRQPGETLAPAVLAAGDAVARVAFAPDGRQLASASRTGVVLWDTATGARLASWEMQQAAGKVAFSPCGELLLWSDPSQRSIRLQGISDDHAGTVFGRAFTFSGDGWHLIVSGHRGPDLVEIDPQHTARTWLDLQRQGPGCEERAFRMPLPVSGHDLAVSPDGRTLAVAAGEAGLLFWDVATGEPRDRIDVGHCSGPVLWSPDGNVVAVGVWATHWKAVLWDVRALRRRAVIGTSSRMSDLAFTPDGALLVSCEDDGLRIWETATGLERRFVALFDDRALGVAFCPDGRLAALGTEKGTIRLWPAELLRPD